MTFCHSEPCVRRVVEGFARKNLLSAVFERSFDNAAFSRPARHEHCPCYVRPFAVGINFVEPAFARSEIKVNLYLACLIAVLSNPPDFVAALCRDDIIAVDICINGQLLYYRHKNYSRHIDESNFISLLEMLIILYNGINTPV